MAPHMEVIQSEKHCRTIEVVKMRKMCVYVLRGSACISVCTCENAEVQFSVCLGECLLQVFHLWVKLTWLTIQAKRWQDLILYLSFFLTLTPSPILQILFSSPLSGHLSYFLFILLLPLPFFPFFLLLFFVHVICWSATNSQARL